MHTLTRTDRLIAAAVAACTTLTLFSAVVSIAEPQRGVLMAKTEQAERLAAARLEPVAVAQAATVAVK